LDTFTGGADLGAAAEIEANGALVDATGANLVVHLSDSTIDAIPPFEDRLVGKPVLVTDTPYEVTLHGTPNESFSLFVSALPGFLEHAPPTADPRRFLDMNPATFQVLLSATVGANGQFKFTTTISSSSGLAGTTFLMQAIVVDPATGQPGDPTNVMVLRV